MITATLKTTIARLLEADKELTEEVRKRLLSVFDTETPVTYSEEELITGQEAAKMLKVTRKTILNLAKAGRITEIRRTERKIMYVQREIERMLAGLPARPKI